MSVVIIGRQPQHDFSELIAFLRGAPAIQIHAEFATISDAMSDAALQWNDVDLAVVLQLFSDEYTAAEVGLLIGQMLFRRVFCCYGPWCQADGRSHEIWPISTRMPASSATAMIADEVKAFQRGQPPLLPMAAAEEVFVHRLQMRSCQTDMTGRSIVVISDEVALRNTVASLFRHSDGAIRESKVRITSFSEAIGVIREAAAHEEEVVTVVDLDPPDTVCADLLNTIRTEFTKSMILGISVFPAGAFSQPGLPLIIDKTELLTGLEEGFSIR